MTNFIVSLQVMGLGMLGIFSVTIILILVMKAITKIFPAPTEEPEKER